MMRFHAELRPRSRCVPSSAGAGLSAVLLLLVACQGSAPTGPGTPIPDPTPAEAGSFPAPSSDEDPVGAPGDEREAQAIASIRQGAYAEARALLGELLVERHLARAEAELAADSPEDALVALDEVLTLEPRHPAGLLLKAHASLALAEKGMARGGSALLVEGSLLDALRYYLRAEESVESMLGASRSAWLLRRSDEALKHAQRADELLAGGAEPEGLRLVPERVLSEAAYSAYVAAKSEEAAAEVARERFTDAEDALSRLLGRTAEDPWVWGTLSDLYVWEEMLDDARGVLERGLDRAPEDQGLLRRLADVSRRAGGPVAAEAAFAALNERHPEVPLAMWHQAVESFDADVVQVMASFAEDYEAPEDPEALPRAIAETEEQFRACRELEPSYAASCQGYEVMCRAALGWTHYALKDYDAAVAAFRSMEDVFERGMEWQLEGRLLSGVMGLHLCGKDVGDAGDLKTAGEIYAVLHEYQPDDENWANNAGFYLRDAAVNLEVLGRRLCAAARSELTDEEALTFLRKRIGLDETLVGTPEEKAAFMTAANAAMDEAREIMSRSRLAYLRAAELAPEDVRIVNDTALVLVYYLHTDLELAEDLLLRCVAMGEEQLKNEELTEDQIFEIENAWGDAFQNLGVLYSNLKNDDEAAIPWFERSVEIGPEPRPLITNFWLPLLRGELEPEAAQDLLDLRTWAEPCTEPGR